MNALLRTPRPSLACVLAALAWLAAPGLSQAQVNWTQTAGGTYSITHAPFIAGMRKYRIKIPGDPANQGAASAAIPILVTPATTSLLRPEAPGNSSLPSEGHV